MKAEESETASQGDPYLFQHQRQRDDTEETPKIATASAVSKIRLDDPPVFPTDRQFLASIREPTVLLTTTRG